VSTKVYLSTLGRTVDPDDAKISVFDRGFLFGDSVYETMRTAGGLPVELQRHVARLHRSAAGIGLDIPFRDPEIAAAITGCHQAAGNEESYVRVIVTRGTGPIMLDPRQSESPTLVVVVQTLHLPSDEDYERGVSAVIVEVQKAGGGLLDPGIKTGNYLNNILALRQAIARGAEDAILSNGQGHVAEGATSNVFFVKDGELCTPHLETGLLAGITREVVCELATETGMAPTERVVRPDELRAADEVFLTSSVRGIMPVTRLDGRSVAQGGAGPVTRALRDRYARYLAEYNASGLAPVEGRG
jgi:branched-chain amino acid aminotransferase